MRKHYEVDAPNRLAVVPEPGILFTRDNARLAYYALKDMRVMRRSIPEQDELCDELAAILFLVPALAEPEGTKPVHTADCGLQGSGLDKHCTCPAGDEGPFEPGEVIEYISHRTGPAGNSGQWVPGVFDRYPDQPGFLYVIPLRRLLAQEQGLAARLCGRREVRPVNPELVSEARSWIADNAWRNLSDDEDVADLTDLQIVAGIQRYYTGGWTQFAASNT